jgi:hypothetical protein
MKKLGFSSLQLIFYTTAIFHRILFAMLLGGILIFGSATAFSLEDTVMDDAILPTTGSLNLDFNSATPAK